MTDSAEVLSPAVNESDCLRWRCWLCNQVWRADEQCSKCKVRMEEFEGTDFGDIIVVEGQQQPTLVVEGHQQPTLVVEGQQQPTLVVEGQQQPTLHQDEWQAEIKEGAAARDEGANLEPADVEATYFEAESKQKSPVSEPVIHEEDKYVKQLTEDEIFAQSIQKEFDTEEIKVEPPVSEEEDPKTWSCLICTFKNSIDDWLDLDNSKCEMCE